jgi:hypothetical protein
LPAARQTDVLARAQTGEKMDRTETVWHIACWNLAIFAIICAMTLVGGLDASAMMVG